MTIAREPLFGATADTHLWCLHCERTYLENQVRQADDGSGLELCAYPDCEGDTVVDAIDWINVRHNREHTYPKVPELGVVYPLYVPVHTYIRLMRQG